MVITGPTGWIGSALLAYLGRTRGSGWEQRVLLFGSSERTITAPDGTVIPMRALRDVRPADLDGAHVIHMAYLTKEKVDSLGEEAFAEHNDAIDAALLSALAPARPLGVFVASSGAAALAQDRRDRHPYGLAKLRQEERFLGWSASSGVAVLAGRIFNIAGPYINKVESYALGSFIMQARRRRSITVSATVPTFRSFVHIDDVCALAMRHTESPIVCDRPMDFSGAEILEMMDIAMAVAIHFGLGADAVRRAEVDFERSSSYLGDAIQAKRLAMSLNLPLFPFATQLADTARWLSATCN